MENFLKIYIQKIQQNLKAVAFLTIQFFRERADFSTTKKKQAAKNFQRCNIQPKPESNILYYHSSSKAISLGSRCHLCSILQFVCHDYLYQFSFLSSKAKSKYLSGRNYCFDSQFLLFTRTVTKRFTRRWHIFFLVLIDLWFVAL